MGEQVPSKDQLRFSWSWDAIALNWRISMVDMGDGMLAGYDHLAGYYERRLIEEIERLRTALRGIQSCSTCEACRGAATLALGEAPQPPSPIPFAGVSKGVNYEALANATYPERMYGGDTVPEPAAEDSCKEPEPCVAQMALDSLQASIGRLSMAMGNPAVHWDESSSLESAVIDEAARRLAQPPGAGQ